jgi:hypothetical protein
MTTHSGRPQIYDNYLGMRYILYFATTPSGARLPLVVVTAKQLPYTDRRRWQRWASRQHRSWVYFVVIEDIKGPSRASTLAWIRKMASVEEYEEGGWQFNQWAAANGSDVHAVCDNLQGHKTKAVAKEMAKWKVKLHMMAPWWGRFTSPLDNGFNAPFRRLHHWFRSRGYKGSPVSNLGAIVLAYFEVPDRDVFNAYHAAGWHDMLVDDNNVDRRRRTSSRSPSSIVRSFSKIGYIGAGKWEEVHEDAVHEFEHWASTAFRNKHDAVKYHTVIKLPDDLDGAKNNVYGRAPLEGVGYSYGQ